MKNETASEALVLKTTPFKENKVILHLFTKEFGLISAMVSTKKSSYLSSMMLIEGVLKRGRGDFYTLTEPHILNAFANLRQDFTLLQTSAKLMNTISKILVKDKPTPALFILTKNTLKAFSKDFCPKPLYHCFILKVLLFEGLLPLNPLEMNKDLSDDEGLSYLSLATAKSFESLKTLSITPFLEKVIDEYVTFTLG
jgi:DNA repair protein RecO